MRSNHLCKIAAKSVLFTILICNLVFGANLLSDSRNYNKEVKTASGMTLYMDTRNADIEITAKNTDLLSVNLNIEISDIRSSLRDEFFSKQNYS